MENRQHDQVCCICGDAGYSELLVHCCECCDLSIHSYCLTIISGSEDDTNIFYWVCEICCPSIETNPYEVVLFEDEPQPLQILLPKSFSGKSESEEETSNQCQHIGKTPKIASKSIADCDEDLLSSRFIEIPEAISEGLVLRVSSSGEITIHESGNFLSLTSKPNDIGFDTLVKQPGPIMIEPDCAHADGGVQNDDDNEQGCSVENTVELDFGTDEEIDSETMELDIATDIENNLCYHGAHPTNHDFKDHKDTFSGTVVSSSEENMEDQVPQKTKASEIEVSQHTLQPRLSDNEFQSSISPEMSIPASVLDMANELLESTLEKIDELVGPYKISSDLAPILRDILNKYGDIFHDCDIEPDTFLVTVCETIQHLQSIPFKSLRQKHVDFVRDALKVPEACGVDVKWLYRHCDYLQEIIHQTVQYLALKQEMNQTICNVQLKKDTAAGVKEGRLKQIEGGMKNIKSLWRRIYGKSLADGLF
ncbi:hypothetical protein vseg_018784 [Gypsophila vaccaria]